MPLHLPELLLLFCFARGVTSKELQDMPRWESETDHGANLGAAENFAQDLGRTAENESIYALAITKAAKADKRVLRKLTESLFSIPRRCKDAPR